MFTHFEFRWFLRSRIQEFSSFLEVSRNVIVVCCEISGDFPGKPFFLTIARVLVNFLIRRVECIITHNWKTQKVDFRSGFWGLYRNQRSGQGLFTRSVEFRRISGFILGI